MIADIRQQTADLIGQLKALDRQLQAAEAAEAVKVPALILGRLSVALDASAVRMGKAAKELAKAAKNGSG